MNVKSIGLFLLHFANRLGVLGIAAIIAVLVTLFWANPFTLFSKKGGGLVDSTVRWVKGKETQSTRTFITEIEKKGRLKVLTCYAGDFLDAPYDPEQRKLATYRYQWEGRGEYVLDLNDVKIETTDTVAVIEWRKGSQVRTVEEPKARKLVIKANVPFLDPDTLRTLPISPRCEISWNSFGHTEEANRLRTHILQFVGAALKAHLSTKGNRNRAKKNAEILLRALCAPGIQDPQKDIKIEWIE